MRNSGGVNTKAAVRLLIELYRVRFGTLFNKNTCSLRCLFKWITRLMPKLLLVHVYSNVVKLEVLSGLPH
ncbi:hypothetical protein NDU88_004505 [Pleurodeles waltl]|uniref:Uncharacterized protein n=1 Tax=Pleurodeles waltl TaxID=8319 RepID=A0AAV7VJ54_PLEWA|nr:hypothetical protein NDU88_004505 [Pleurodeles waltl]